MMKNIIYLMLVVILLSFINGVNADIISINSYGTEEVILISEQNIEGFFFGNLPISTEEPALPISIFLGQPSLNLVCYYYNQSNSSYYVRQKLLNQGYNTNETEITKMLIKCKEQQVSKIAWWFWILILIILMLICLIYYYRKKIYFYLILLKDEIKEKWEDRTEKNKYPDFYNHQE